MSLKYHIIAKGKPGDKTAPKKFYATARSSGEVSMRSLSEEIARISTVSTIDTMAVLEALVQVIPERLSDGFIVRLGDLGNFYMTLKSEGADKEEDFKPSMIKGASIKFRPGMLIKDSAKIVKFEKLQNNNI